MPTYTVRKTKVFRGREGNGFNAELLKDGKPVAFVMNDASGGPTDFDWYDNRMPRSAAEVVNPPVRPTVEVTNPDNGVTYRVSPEEAALLDHVKDMFYPPDPSFGNTPLRMGMDGFLEELVFSQKEQQALERACKNKTSFHLKNQRKGEYYTLNAPFTPAVKAHLVAKYGDNLEVVYNEMNPPRLT